MRRRSTLRTTRRSVRRMQRRRIRMRRRRILLTGGLIAIAVKGTSTAIKLSQQDAQRIESHTGQKPEDLSEAQLEATINDLNIETHELTDADAAAIESADAEPLVQPASSPQPTAPQADYITELKRLAELRDVGIITPEEFEAKKQQLLGL